MHDANVELGLLTIYLRQCTHTWEGSLKKSFASLSVSDLLKSLIYKRTPGTAQIT